MNKIITNDFFEDYNKKQEQVDTTLSKINQGNLVFMSETLSQLQSLYKDYEEMRYEIYAVKKEIGEIKDVAVLAAEEAKQVVEDVKNHVFLSDPEVSELAIAINEKSTKIAQEMDRLSYFDEKDFGKIVGKVRQGLYSMLRKSFGVSSYKKVKHKQFQEAIEKASSFTVKDYIKYLNARRVYQ
ncbi:ORF6C domain protein [compost metagenome]